MLAPYKLLVLVLWSKHNWISRTENGRVSVQLGPAARCWKMPSSRVRSYLQQLSDARLITDLVLRYGSASFKVPDMPFTAPVDTLEPIRTCRECGGTIDLDLATDRCRRCLGGEICD